MSVLFDPLQLLLTNQLEMEKMKVEQEKKKCYLAQEALKEKVLHEKTCLINNVFLRNYLKLLNHLKRGPR